MKPWDNIELTEEEKAEALTEGRKRKYFHDKNKPYWIAEEQAAIARHEEAKRIARDKRK